MGNNELDPSVEKFKQFIQANPKIIEAVRRERLTWQELYEDWYLLGEEDPRWEEFRKTEKKKRSTSNKETNTAEEINNDADQKKDWVGQIMGVVKNMDAQQIESQIHHLSQAISAIQGVLSQFQNSNQVNNVQKNEHPPHPFMFRKD
ncbi:YlbD family protein [Neobacillus sp. LXY-4]|uniref:YlbD family protein n=1 Tax=Neobacillus sp. LXY-4 TaxID=3379826 RepID=UPI003EE386EB